MQCGCVETSISFLICVLKHLCFITKYAVGGRIITIEIMSKFRLALLGWGTFGGSVIFFIITNFILIFFILTFFILILFILIFFILTKKLVEIEITIIICWLR